MNKWFIALRNVLIMLVLCLTVPLIATHALIITVDPLGAYTNDVNWSAITYATDKHPTGVSMNEGKYNLIGYDVTMLADGLRYVPATSNSECTVAFIGDSFTWGFAVNDSDTFANRVAQSIDASVLNAGRNGYNAQQVLATRRYYDADLYVYLHVWNDHQPPVEAHRHNASLPLVTYWQSLGQNSLSMFRDVAESYLINDDYTHVMDALTEDDSVLVFAFEDALFTQLGTYASEHFNNVVLLPDSVYVHDMVSYADPHPNANGHQQIAYAMLPYVEGALSTICN